MTLFKLRLLLCGMIAYSVTCGLVSVAILVMSVLVYSTI